MKSSKSNSKFFVVLKILFEASTFRCINHCHLILDERPLQRCGCTGFSSEKVCSSNKYMTFLVCIATWCFELPRNSLKLRCSFAIMELELNRSVSGEVSEASRNTVYEVKKEISGEDT